MASTTRTRQTTAARKKAAARPANGLGDDLDFEPLRIDADDEVEEERVPLFYIGDDEYTIPKLIPPGVALQFMREAREHGRELAAAPLLIRVLGEDAYMALEQSKSLSEDQMEWIINKVLDLALGRKKQGGKAK
ncbi:hypothetical protein [Streptomyces spinosisporus]|uniref:Tail assembly chaperone n=1 Tax=Streptomyces spinosisporus TaxID=2927582 RepID=A0ABS9XW45_9ACTN|nr:hypothetical protein [Streptomyces spinosisporus]MCI3246305.1 hypothetical protein [Streptomyces spinosisporus]